MTDEELIEATRAELKKRGVDFGDFWEIVRSPTSLTTVFFWGKPPGGPNYSCQFEEAAGKLFWCNA